MSYIKKYTVCRAYLLTLIVGSFSLTVTATETTALPFNTANSLMLAVGKEKLATAQLENTLNHCSTKFPHLQQSANNARRNWQKRNQTVLQQTALVNKAVIESVKQHASPFIAEEMALKMDNVIKQTTKQQISEFRAKSRKQQHYLCNRLILSVTAGEQDLQQQNPDETARLMTFKP